ncbi:MAG: 1-acyl-sn-glycerol-3-phosphate acyltransferase [Bacteroidetes bacterium]|nr:1-acyl-sn-glycerol-3-phosphate acyltransferase [Bacteroidota bacterium]
MKTATRIFFKEIRISGLENIPKDKPIIIAANHNSAFMDAIVTAVFIEPQIYFLTRSDVFNTPLKRWILKKMNLIPIYRLQEGAGNLHKNEQTFEDCYKLLAQKKSLLIFSEGICIQEKRLQKLKKGTARIAFGAQLYNDFKLDLQVLPLGINYTKPAQFRSNLYLKFAPPIHVNSYNELFKEDENKAFTAFTRDLEKQMGEQIVNLKNKNTDELYDQLVEIYLPEVFGKLKLNSANKEHYFYVLRGMGEALNEMYETSPTTCDNLKVLTASYWKGLSEIKLKDKVIKKGATSFVTFAMKCALAVLLFPIHLVSLVFNYWPYKLSFQIAQKTCKHVEFVASVIIGTAAFMYLISFVVWGAIGAYFLPTLSSKIGIIFVLPLLGFFSLHFNSFLKNLALEINGIQNKEACAKLKQQRKHLIEQLEESLLPKIKNRNTLHAAALR